MYMSNSPASSPSDSISIGFPGSPSSSFSLSQPSSPSSNGLTCAYPSWPTSSTLSAGSSTPEHLAYSPPNSFISDEDLFGDVEPMLLSEAPAPPRVYHQVAQPLLPLYASAKPYGGEKKKPRRSSGKKRGASGKMETIVEGKESAE